MDFLELFYAVAPEFSNEDAGFLITHLDNADSLVAKSIVAAVRTNMVVYLAAHNIDLANKRKGAGGQVISVSEGKLNIQYAASGNIKSDYDLSSYGRRYKDLVRSVTITPLTRSIY